MEVSGEVESWPEASFMRIYPVASTQLVPPDHYYLLALVPQRVAQSLVTGTK